MTNDSEIQQITRRPLQYWFQDGLGELMVGSLFTVMGLFFLVQDWATNPVIAYLAGLLGLIAILVGPWLGRFLIARLKENVVYPRTGYVRYPTYSRSRRILTSLIALLVSSGLVFLVSAYRDALNWLPLIEGAAIGAMLYIQASQARLIRLYLEALASIFLGVVIAILAQGSILGSGLYFLSFGLILVLGGGIALVRYLRKLSKLSEGESR